MQAQGQGIVYQRDVHTGFKRVRPQSIALRIMQPGRGHIGVAQPQVQAVGVLFHQGPGQQAGKAMLG